MLGSTHLRCYHYSLKLTCTAFIWSHLLTLDITHTCENGPAWIHLIRNKPCVWLLSCSYLIPVTCDDLHEDVDLSMCRFPFLSDVCLTLDAYK